MLEPFRRSLGAGVVLNIGDPGAALPNIQLPFEDVLLGVRLSGDGVRDEFTSNEDLPDGSS